MLAWRLAESIEDMACLYFVHVVLLYVVYEDRLRTSVEQSGVVVSILQIDVEIGPLHFNLFRWRSISMHGLGLVSSGRLPTLHPRSFATLPLLNQKNNHVCYLTNSEHAIINLCLCDCPNQQLQDFRRY